MADNDLSWLDETGSSQYTIADVTNLKSQLAQLGAELYRKMAENARAAQLVNSGAMIDSNNTRVDVTETADGEEMDFYLLYYFKFMDLGVKGVKSSAKAPGSPYQFKNYGMSATGRKNIRQWIQNSGKLTTDTSKKRKIGLELKGSKKKLTKSALERETDKAIYMIKKYGLRRTDFFSNAARDTFSKAAEILGPAIVKDLKIKIILTNTE
jgi:hypothetical protein